MDTPHLNANILLNLMHFFDAKTICALRQTCKEFYKMGAEYLLLNGVSLTTDAHIESFDAFIFADPSSRLPLLHHLTLARSPENSTNPIWTGLLVNKLLSNVAAHGRLLTLTVRYSEDLLCSWEELPLTIARISTLKHLKITSVGLKGFSMLDNLSSRLLSAHISVREGHWESDEGDGVPSLALLLNSRNTMQRMRLTGFSSYWPPEISFPNVTSLTLRHGPIPRTSNLVHCFPNLHELRMLFMDTLGESLRVAREINQNGQRHYGTWTSLRHFSGSPCVLFVLAIRAHIPSLMLHEEAPIPLLAYVDVVLLDARPLHLELSMPTGSTPITLGFLDMIMNSSMGNLLSLCLTLHIRAFEKDLDLGRAWNVVYHIVSSLTRLTSVDITFTLCLPKACFVEKLTEGWNLDSMARLIRRNHASRTLKSVTLSLLNHRTRGNRIARLGPVHEPEHPYGAEARDLLFFEEDEP